jgi:hypothetical protein
MRFMKQLRLVIFPLTVLMGAVGTRATVRAQWDTPNRAFHKDTAFPLDGRHMTVACASCHIKGVTKGTPTTCFACHWERRQDDRYRLRLGSSCETCHRPTAWTAVKWDHGAVTGMPLNVAHKTVPCESCHRNAQFTSATTSCINCHRKDYDATRTPNHAAAGFSTTCDACHRPGDATFTQARFDHNAAFPLVGTHAMQGCAMCHANGRYKGTPRDCVGCHRDEYQRTTNPNHGAAGYSTACETCHRATDPSWLGTAINHSQFFPLVGKHSMTACSSCHVNNRFKGTPRDCVGCHLDAYQRTANPSHAAAGFPFTCESCHRASDTTWMQGRFTHPWFPITSGKHAGNPCSACHTNPASYQAFTCLTCHGRTKMDDTHRGRTGYRYDSIACYSCHPNGRS